MTLADRTRRTLCQYWAEKLAVEPAAFETAGVAVGATTSDDIELFVRDGAVLIGAPSALAARCERESYRLAAADSDDEIREWFDAVESVDRILGPSYYGYADAKTFDPVDADARVLRAADEPAFESLRTAVPDEEWDQGGPAFVPGRTVGRFVAGDLVSVADYDVWDDLIAQIAVVTHPDHRSAGNGRAVVSRVTNRALADGLLPQYRTADAWPWSIALARGLGFERFATAYLGVREA